MIRFQQVRGVPGRTRPDLTRRAVRRLGAGALGAGVLVLIRPRSAQ